MKRLALGIILIPVVLCFLTGILFWNWYIITVKNVPIEVQITNTSVLGFNTGTDKLYFGTLAPEGAGQRKTTVVAAENAVVVIKIQGQVAQWMTVSENNVRLQPNTPRDILFTMSIPLDAKPGNYTGTAVIEYHKPFP